MTGAIEADGWAIWVSNKRIATLQRVSLQVAEYIADEETRPFVDAFKEQVSMSFVGDHFDADALFGNGDKRAFWSLVFDECAQRIVRCETGIVVESRADFIMYFSFLARSLSDRQFLIAIPPDEVGT